MSTELATNGRAFHLDPGAEAVARYETREIEFMAKNAAASRMFGMDAAQAFTLMLLAQSEGLHPIQALKRYHVIKGRPAMRADAMQAEFQRHGGCLRWTKTTADECQAEAWHPTYHPEHIIFGVTLKELVESRVACTWEGDERSGKGEWRIKDMYLKFPRQMLRARTISEIVRAIDPGIIVGVYTPEEIADFAPDDRGPVQATAVIERQGGPSLVHEATHEPQSAAVSEAKQWVRTAISAANNRFHNRLLIDGKGDQFRPLANESQVINRLVTQWIAEGSLQEKDILKADGMRDRAKVGAAFQVAWHQDAREIRADIWSYLHSKAKEAAKPLGVELPEEEPELPPSLAADSDESAAMADEDPAEAG